MPFLSCMLTYQIFFYLTIVCNLARCFSNASSSDLEDETRLVTGCRYTYPDYVSPYVISCRNMYVNEIPVHQNVTKMELVNVPTAALNETLMPAAIRSDLVDLRQLYWTKSHIKLLESVSIPTLVDLDLSWNVIQDVRPDALKQLIKLKKFNISHNNIDRLPPNLLVECRFINVLSLSHNQLKSLPHAFFDTLQQLEILDLSDNHLSHLMATIFKHNSRLLNLNLSHNKITTLPARLFWATSSLQSLSLEDNHLFALEADAFVHLHELMVLNLGKNPLWSLPTTLLPNNNTLFILTISHTRLLRSHLSVLRNLRWLRSLHLTDNANLQSLYNDTFASLTNLKTIQLENNNFTQLPYSILDTKPEDIFLDGNPWPCDCSLQWIPLWIEGMSSGLDNGAKSNLHLSTQCNDTTTYLVDALLEMQCKPAIVKVSPFSYKNLDVNTRLICEVYANPTPSISWITPNGFVYNEQLDSSSDGNEPLRYRPSYLDSYQHLQTVPHNNIRIHLHQNGELEIKQMSRDDAGEYICIANNNVGESVAYTRLYIDPSIMQRIKTGSILCGLLWVNTFVLFSIVYLLKRRYSKRTQQEKRTLQMQENMDVYKLQQITKLKDRCKNQMNRIKNNCSTQVDWMKENYKESVSMFQDHRISYLTNQYNEQMVEIREYYLTQMHKVREHFDQQQSLILEFSINRVGNGSDPGTRFTTEATLVKMENGTTPTIVSPEEEEIYKYNDLMKSEIQKLTSLSNLHDTFAEINRSPNIIPSSENDGNNPTTSYHSPKATENSVVSNGKLRTPEDEGDEKTSMLPCPR